MISMIASVGRNGEIGVKNQLIWHIPKDMKFFKSMTMGHKVVMGRKTFESLPGSLPGREIIVITSCKTLGNIAVYSSINELVNKYLNSEEEIFIIGGSSIYEQFVEYANKLYLTKVDDECLEADAYFPKINNSEWNKEKIDEDVYDDIHFEIFKYTRID